MIIKNQQIYQEATQILAHALNDKKAQFRTGQYEAIEAVFENKRSLVVQKTGWGKSFVYFISTKINRNKKKGVSIVISPLLVLIENQIDAANKVGLKCEMLSSSNKDNHERVIEQLKNNSLDLLFTTPESLFNILQPHLKDINLGMFIIDEAHCISDWGHDFRLDYRKIVDVLNQLKDKDFPILATTATANNRVIEDLKKQIGPNLYVSRGPLYRDNLKIQLLDLENKVNRYAWILENLPKLDGTGIIYCLTQRDCENLTTFLKNNGINVEYYHSSLDVETCDKNINLFVKNKIKALVSTIKLGMGYDKPDVSFVIHYQVPKNIVSYYQQIGRAARNIPSGYAIMLKGGNDFEILDYFIKNSFPNEHEMRMVLKQFDTNSWSMNESGLSSTKIANSINAPLRTINKALKFLEFDGVINRSGVKYYLTGNKFVYNKKHYEEITQIRMTEIVELQLLFTQKKCLNKIIINALDDQSDLDCGKCMNCLKKDIVQRTISKKSIELANEFLDFLSIPIKPKGVYKVEGTGVNYYNEDKVKYYSRSYGYQVKTDSLGRDYVRIPDEFYKNQEGIALSKYGDEGLGNMVAECKNNKLDYPQAVFDRAIKIITPFIKAHKIDTIAYVPSRNNTLVDNFARKIAKHYGLTCNSYFVKVLNTSQKLMTNRSFQQKNVEESYRLNTYNNIDGKSILLLDDMVDSGWTFAFLGKELLRNHAKLVFPVALADTSIREVDND